MRSILWYSHEGFLTLSGWGVGAKSPPYQFSPSNFDNVGISLQNFLTFSFNPFATLV